MPNLLYHTKNDPPRWWDHLFAHAFPVFVSAGGVGIGVMMLLTLYTDHDWSRAAMYLPDTTILVMAFCLIGGGLLYAAGAFLHLEPIAKNRLMLRVGLLLLSAGWAARAVGLAFPKHPAGPPPPVDDWYDVVGLVTEGTSIWLSVCLAFACFVTWVGSWFASEAIDATVKDVVRISPKLRCPK